ncbi:MAG: hypothetical protein QG580_463 [Patescibacteria group bacterium]|nr:hypothetical protein [Patescibacteria group bacterium]
MDDTQKQLIQDQMRKIPKEVRDAIENSDWERVVFNIGREHKLHIDDIDTLSVETILTMIGLEHPKDFYENVQSRANIDTDTMNQIVDEINSRLFTKIRLALQEYYEKLSAGEIMHPEEKQNLKKSGIVLDDDEDLDEISNQVKEIVSIKENPKPIVETINITEPKPAPNPPEKKEVRIPEIKFDPYREPIE